MRCATDFVPALESSDVRTPRQWFLPSSFIVSAASGILKDYPIIIYSTKRILSLLPSCNPRNKPTHETPAWNRAASRGACARPH